MKIHIPAFGGIAPALDPRDLPEGGAQEVVNLKGFGGVLEPLRGLGQLSPAVGVAPTPSTIYHYGESAEVTSRWWRLQEDCDFVRSQIADDAQEWTFFVRNNGVDRVRGTYNDYAWSEGVADNPLHKDNPYWRSFELGVAQPTAAASPAFVYGHYPTDEEKKNVGETRVYTYTRVYRTATGYEMESQPAPVASNSTITVWPKVDSTSGMAHVKLTVSVENSYYPGTEPETLVAARNGIGTYFIRLYRSVSGEYLLVKQVEVDRSKLYNTNTAVELIDDVSASSLGEVLPSLTWARSPQGIKGLVSLPNGMMAAFKGRDVYFCEPYRPHAWPVQYVQTVDYRIVGLGRMDTTLVVLTTGAPYFIQGSHPDSMTVVRGPRTFACLSKRSIVSFGDAVVYAAQDGLAEIGPNGARILTEALIRPEQWREFFYPATLMAFEHKSQYVAFFEFEDETPDTDPPEVCGFIYDRSTKNLIHHTYADIHAGYTEPRSGQLYVAWKYTSESGNPGYQIRTWEGKIAAEYLGKLRWRSKVYVTPHQTSFGWAQIEASAYPPGMRFYLYVDGQRVKFLRPKAKASDPNTFWDHVLMSEVRTENGVSYQVYPVNMPFRLPVVVGREFFVEVVNVYRNSTYNNTVVHSITLAQSSAELRELSGS